MLSCRIAPLCVTSSPLVRCLIVSSQTEEGTSSTTPPAYEDTWFVFSFFSFPLHLLTAFSLSFTSLLVSPLSCCSLATRLPLTTRPQPCVSPCHASVTSPQSCPPIVTRRPLSHLPHRYAPSLRQASVTKMQHHSLCTAAPVNAVQCYYVL